MIRLVENVTSDSDIAYFGLTVAPQVERYKRVRDLDAVRRAQELLQDQGPFPNVDLIVTFLEDGVIKGLHKHLLHEHLGALDPPIDSFITALYGAEDSGRISEEEVTLVGDSVSVDWSQYEVFDKTGRYSEVDEAGLARPSVFTDFDTVDPDNNLELIVAQQHNLNAFVYQVELEWIEGLPVLPNYYQAPGYVEHVTLGTVDDNGQFTAVTSVPDPSHPMRRASS